MGTMIPHYTASHPKHTCSGSTWETKENSGSPLTTSWQWDFRLLLCNIYFNTNACKSPYEFPRWFFVIWNNIVSLCSMSVTDVGRIRSHTAEKTRTQFLGRKWLLMVIPLKNTIQTKSNGKLAAIAALKSREGEKKKRLWRNLKTPASSKGTVLFGVEWGYNIEERKRLNCNNNIYSFFWYLYYTISWINSSYLPTLHQLVCLTKMQCLLWRRNWIC